MAIHRDLLLLVRDAAKRDMYGTIGSRMDIRLAYSRCSVPRELVGMGHAASTLTPWYRRSPTMAEPRRSKSQLGANTAVVNAEVMRRWP